MKSHYYIITKIINVKSYENIKYANKYVDCQRFLRNRHQSAVWLSVLKYGVIQVDKRRFEIRFSFRMFHHIITTP